MNTTKTTKITKAAKRIVKTAGTYRTVGSLLYFHSDGRLAEITYGPAGFVPPSDSYAICVGLDVTEESAQAQLDAYAAQ